MATDGDDEERIPTDGAADENTPLLKAPDEATWTRPRAFFWIQAAIFANVFLYGFDGTITAATYAVISSEFDAANTASWLTTSYLVTCTAFQPLYGRFSDIFGRRICFFVSTITFAAGCLGCGAATNIVLVNCMRALTGFGGGVSTRYSYSRLASTWFRHSLLRDQFQTIFACAVEEILI